MLNIEQFATICAHSLAIEMAKPGNAGPKFTWAESFPRMATSHIKTQWWMANRNMKALEMNQKMIQRIAEETAQSFALITGKP